jgi:hypothetical protein
MRSKSIGVVAAAFAAIPAVVGAPAHASAAHTSITDVAGDANGTDPRIYGSAPTPRDVQTAPVSNPSVDVTGASLVNDRIAIQFVQADPGTARHLVVTIATPKCDHVTISWDSTYDAALLLGCHGTQRIAIPAPKFSANTLTFALPSPLPRWLPAGTRVTALDVQTGGDIDVQLGAVYPPGDYAGGAMDTTL